eukprot:jgi/Psemu1/53719/gm1.53719_g
MKLPNLFWVFLAVTATDDAAAANNKRTLKEIIDEDRRFVLFNSRRLSGECHSNSSVTPSGSSPGSPSASPSGYILKDFGANPSQKLGMCEGDCDRDSDCKGDLMCHQRNTGDPVPYGCLGAPNKDFDYCGPSSWPTEVPTGSPSASPAESPSASPSGYILKDFGANPNQKLGLCEGDCDRDSDCKGDLMCHQRNTGDPVPYGCLGAPNKDFDYCGPSSWPTEVPTGSPSASPAESPSASPSGYILKDFGANPSQKLGMCEGDCDRDSDCKGDLMCHQRNTGDPVPYGCLGAPNKDYDYCGERLP